MASAEHPWGSMTPLERCAFLEEITGPMSKAMKEAAEEAQAMREAAGSAESVGMLTMSTVGA